MKYEVGGSRRGLFYGFHTTSGIDKAVFSDGLLR